MKRKFIFHRKEPRFAPWLFSLSWEQRECGELMEVTSVRRIHQSDWKTEGIRFLRARDIVAAIKNEEVSDYLYISEEKYEECSKISGKVAVGDLLVTGVGTIGVPYLISNNDPVYFKDGNIIWFKNNNAINGTFFYYSFISDSIQNFISESAGIGTVGTYTIETGKKTPIALPNHKEQQKIGSYFANLDTLITLHQRVLYNKKRNKNILRTISANAWEQRKIGDLCSRTTGGGTPRTGVSEYWDGEIPWFQSSDFKEGIVITQSSNKHISQEGLKESAAQLIPAQSIAIVARVGFGKLALIPFQYTTSQDILSLSNLTIAPLYGVYSIYKKLQSELMAVQGTSIKGVTKDDLLAKDITVSPNTSEQRKIGDLFQSLDTLITLHQRKSAKQKFSQNKAQGIYTSIYYVDLIVVLTIAWEQRKLGELVDRVVRKNVNNESSLPLTISAQYGLVDQITYFNNRVASRDVSNYFLVLNGEFAYNKSSSDGFPFGTVKRLDLHDMGVLSTLYIVFSIKDYEQLNSDFLTVYFDTNRWHKGVSERAAEGARNHGLLNISAEDFLDIDITIPQNTSEQASIGKLFEEISTLITLHQRELTHKLSP